MNNLKLQATSSDMEDIMVHIAHYGCKPELPDCLVFTPEQQNEIEARLNRWGQAKEREENSMSRYGFEPNTD